MIKGPQIDALPEDFRYITAITKPQIAKMLHEGVLQYGLFDDHVCEVDQQGIRYILRRNPVRAQQLAEIRESKVVSLRALASVVLPAVALSWPVAVPGVSSRS